MADERPRCVTVIGWVWIVVGGLICLAAALALAFPESNVRVFGMVFPTVGAMQICVGIFAVYAGMRFLKLKAWARGVLEVLSWLLLLYAVGFSAFIVRETLRDGFKSSDAIQLAMCAAIMGIYVFSLAAMIKYLRSRRVCEAMYAKAGEE